MTTIYDHADRKKVHINLAQFKADEKAVKRAKAKGYVTGMLHAFASVTAIAVAVAALGLWLRM